MRGITRDLANVSRHMSINGTHSKVGQTHLWRAQSLLLGINLSFQLAVSIWGDKSHSGVWQVMWPPDCHVKCVQSNPWSFIFTSSTLIAPYLLNLALDVWATLRFLLLIFEPAVIGIANTPKTSRLNTASIFFWRRCRKRKEKYRWKIGNSSSPLKITVLWKGIGDLLRSKSRNQKFLCGTKLTFSLQLAFKETKVRTIVL